MKTKGRRKSTNIVDLRPGAKGDRLKPTPKRTLPAELKGTKAMNSALSIKAYKVARRPKG